MALTIEKIKDDEARTILLQARKLGEEVVESTLGHKRFEANSLLIIGLAKLIAQKHDTKN